MHFQVRCALTKQVERRYEGDGKVYGAIDSQASGPMNEGAARSYCIFMQANCAANGEHYYVTNDFSTYSTDTR